MTSHEPTPRQWAIIIPLGILVLTAMTTWALWCGR